MDALLPFRKIGHHLYISSHDVHKLPVRTDDLPVCAAGKELVTQTGFDFTCERLNQPLIINVDKSRLIGEERITTYEPPALNGELLFADSLHGMTMNYNLFASDDSKSLAAYSEIRTFGAAGGHMYTSFNSRFADLDYSGDNTGVKRLMTHWSRENVNKRLQLTVGDNFPSSQTWSSSVHFGGISLTSDNSLQPRTNTISRDILTDTVTLPSTVDLYIQGMKTTSRDVAPDQFTLSATPVLSGKGNAQSRVSNRSDNMPSSVSVRSSILSRNVYQPSFKHCETNAFST